MLKFVLVDLRRNWIGTTLLMLLIALATALGVAVTLQERALRLGSARAAAPFDLVVGAAGSETQLVLSSVFLQPAPLTLTKPQILADLRADPRVEAAIPVGFGDFIEGAPIIGATSEVIAMLGGLAEGEGFHDMRDAIAGSMVPRQVGSRFHPFHGNPGEAGEVHADVEYHIVGRLQSSGTAWDKAILVPIQSVWNAHDHEHEGHDGHDHTSEPHEHSNDGHDSSHEEHDSHAENHAHERHEHIDEDALSKPQATGVPAIIVKPKTIADAYNLRQQYRSGDTVAVFPAEVLTRLYGTLGDARLVMSSVAIGAQLLVGAAILMIIVMQVMQRRRQIGALRAFGASRGTILVMVWGGIFTILLAGLLAGFAIGYFAARVLSKTLSGVSGIAMPVEFHSGDLQTLVMFLLVSGLATFVPAIIAYRQSPAQALRA